MDPVRARFISRNTRKGTAEVVVYFGEGPNKRSVTRHLVRVFGNRGVGRNLDEAAIVVLDAAEAKERVAQWHYDSLAPLAQIELADLRGILWRLRNFGDEAINIPTGIRGVVEKILRRRVEFVKQTIEAAVVKAKADLDLAKREADLIFEVVPREREFVF